MMCIRHIGRFQGEREGNSSWGAACNWKCESSRAAGEPAKNCISNQWHRNGSDRFREIRGIRGGFSGHEFHGAAQPQPI